MLKFKPYIYYLTFFLLFICVGNDEVLADTLVPESVLKQWGYHEGKRYYRLDYCEPNVDNRLTRRAQGIRSLKPLEKGSHTYYRFSLIVEGFDSSQAAQQRLISLRQSGANHSIMNSKYCDLIDGFVHDKKVYLIHTDVYMFSFKEQPRLIKLLKKYVNRY